MRDRHPHIDPSHSMMMSACAASGVMGVSSAFNHMHAACQQQPGLWQVAGPDASWALQLHKRLHWWYALADLTYHIICVEVALHCSETCVVCCSSKAGTAVHRQQWPQPGLQASLCRAVTVVLPDWFSYVGFYADQARHGTEQRNTSVQHQRCCWLCLN